MKTYKDLYAYLCSMGNLTIAWRKARKGKTLNDSIIEFEEDVERNLINLHKELSTKTYFPRALETFILRDPKTRVISKSHFRDRVVHHALINVIGPIFERRFIYDSCANQKKKGSLFALKRFKKFQRKATRNFTRAGFCLKADIEIPPNSVTLQSGISNRHSRTKGDTINGNVYIKHYFQEVDHGILLEMMRRKIKDEDVLWLISKILNNNVSDIGEGGERRKGMPLGNLTSQFFANIYLNELDYFVKHKLKAKYYIRYVDDFVILHKSRMQLDVWKEQIDNFLKNDLKLELHPDKSRIICLKRGVDFVGFRNYYSSRLLRKRNISTMRRKIRRYKFGINSFEKTLEIYKGWQAYAQWGNTYKLRKQIKNEIIDILLEKI